MTRRSPRKVLTSIALSLALVTIAAPAGYAIPMPIDPEDPYVAARAVTSVPAKAVPQTKKKRAKKNKRTSKVTKVTDRALPNPAPLASPDCFADGIFCPIPQ
jgi:hypothetical protein